MPRYKYSLFNPLALRTDVLRHYNIYSNSPTLHLHRCVQSTPNKKVHCNLANVMDLKNLFYAFV